MKYQYTGITKQQEEVNGVIEAQDEAEAQMRIRALQIRPVEVSEFSEKTSFSLDLSQFSIELSPAIDLKGLIVFMRQFSSLIDSGVPVVQCLDIMFQQERRPGFKKILKKIKEDIETGQGLAEAISRHPRVFSEFVVRVIEAGEISGTLDQSLKRIAMQLEKLGRLRAKVKGAMVYPIATMVIAILVTIFLLIKVIPEVAKLYSSSNAQLPVLTVFVLGISAWVQKNILYMLGVVVGVFVGFNILYRRPEFRLLFDPIVLKVPLFGALIKKSSIARFTRTLGTLVSSGVPLLNAFDICIKLAENMVIKDILKNAVQSITEGKSIVVGLQHKNIFPPMVLHMVNIGEMTGRLDELLGKVSDIYDDEVDDTINVITGLLQPMMIVFVGAIIAFLLLAMYMPIFQLAEKVMGN